MPDKNRILSDRNKSLIAFSFSHRMTAHSRVRSRVWYKSYNLGVQLWFLTNAMQLMQHCEGTTRFGLQQVGGPLQRMTRRKPRMGLIYACKNIVMVTRRRRLKRRQNPMWSSCCALNYLICAEPSIGLEWIETARATFVCWNPSCEQLFLDIRPKHSSPSTSVTRVCPLETSSAAHDHDIMIYCIKTAL